MTDSPLLRLARIVRDGLDGVKPVHDLVYELNHGLLPDIERHERAVGLAEAAWYQTPTATAPAPATGRTITKEEVTRIGTSLTSTMDITPSVFLGEVAVRYVARQLGLTVEDK